MDMSNNCCSGTGDGCRCGPAENVPRCGGTPKWITGFMQTPEGNVPRVKTELDFSDTVGSWKARWGIGRMNYAVEPGLYCVGDPGADSAVFVTANYKMSFDRLREKLSGIDAWILVLDTKGINVWCAAGKGTFGTRELARRIETAGLKNIVAHREIILPQLGAAGVSAHEVKKLTGFDVVYGPVRAGDIKGFLANGKTATKKMRTVTFTFRERIILTPMELVHAAKPALIVFGALFILNAVGLGHYGGTDLYALLGALFIGCVLTEALLPWIPGRAFSGKGALLGLIWAAGVNFLNGWPGTPVYGWLKAIAYLLILPAVSAFYAMYFTGASTFTSLSGVDREMRVALPSMITAVFCGIVLLLINDFIAL